MKKAILTAYVIILCACGVEARRTVIVVNNPNQCPNQTPSNYTLDGNYLVTATNDANQPTGCQTPALASWRIQSGTDATSYYVDPDVTSNAFENLSATDNGGTLSFSWDIENGDSASFQQTLASYNVQLDGQGNIYGDLHVVSTSVGVTTTCNYIVFGKRQ